MFAGLLRKDAALNGLGRLKLSPPLVKALGDVFEEFRTGHVQSIPDVAVRQQADALLKALAPTVQTGDFDGAVVVTEMRKKLTFVSAAKIKDGAAVDKSVREALTLATKTLPPDLKGRIKIDADAVGAVKIHKGELGALGPKEFDMTLGEPNVYIAVRPDAISFPAAKTVCRALKAAITVVPTATTPMFFYDLDIARLAFLFTPDQPDLAKKFFPTGQGGKMPITVEGGPAITARFNTKVSVLSFFGAVGEAPEKVNPSVKPPDEQRESRGFQPQDSRCSSSGLTVRFSAIEGLSQYFLRRLHRANRWSLSPLGPTLRGAPRLRNSSAPSAIFPAPKPCEIPRGEDDAEPFSSSALPTR